MRTSTLLCAVMLLGAPVSRAVAHHSFAAFDVSKELRLSGTVSEVQYTNPHAWLFIDVLDARGQKESWAIEAGGPNILIRQGWKKDTIKVGEKVEVLIHPMRDTTRKGGSLMGIVLPDGRTVGDKVK